MRPNELWNDGVIKGRFISCNRVRIPLTVAWLGTVSMSERGADQTWQCRGLTRKADETRSIFVRTNQTAPIAQANRMRMTRCSESRRAVSIKVDGKRLSSRSNKVFQILVVICSRGLSMDVVDKVGGDR